MPEPVCVGCRVRMKVANIGSGILFTTPTPKFYACDLYRCPKCGHEIVATYGKEPVAEGEKAFSTCNNWKKVEKVVIVSGD